MFGRFIKFLSIISIITNFDVFANQYKNIAIQWGMRAEFHKQLSDPEMDSYEYKKWIKNEVYKDSVYNVIPKCIADCITKQNEFSNVDCLKLKNGEIIEFSIKPSDVNYTTSNWCALILYNLIAEVFYGLIAEVFYGEPKDEVSAIVGATKNKIKEHYSSLKYDSYIDRVAYSVGKYIEVLQFVDVFDMYEGSKEFIQPRGLYRNSYKNFEFYIKDIDLNLPDNCGVIKTDLVGRYREGRLIFYILGDCEVEVDEYFNVTETLKKADLSSGNYAKYLMWKKCNFTDSYISAMDMVFDNKECEKGMIDVENKSKLLANIRKCRESVIDWKHLNNMERDFSSNYEKQFNYVKKLSDEQRCNYGKHCIEGFFALYRC